MNEPLVKLRLLISNARLREAREAQGLTQIELAEKTGIKLYRLQAISSLHILPTEKEELNISAALGVVADYLFPKVLTAAIDEEVFKDRVKLLSPEKVIALTEARREMLSWDGGLGAIEDNIDRDRIAGLLGKAVSELEPKEERVIDLRFGLTLGESKTLDDVGKEFKVSRERVRQIEAKALRKLRGKRLLRRIFRA